MSLRQIVRHLLTTKPHVAHEPVATVPQHNGHIQVKQPNEKELAAGHRELRYQIHNSRNNMAVSMHIAHRIKCASATALDAANELIAQLQKVQERKY